MESLIYIYIKHIYKDFRAVKIIKPQGIVEKIK